MSGAVKVEQPGRTATGEQLLYTAATGEFVLTGTPGHPPHVVDDKQGSITGSYAAVLFAGYNDCGWRVGIAPCTHRDDDKKVSPGPERLVKEE